MYYPIFLFRRLAFASIIVILTDYPIIQLVLIFIGNISIIFYNVYWQPFRSTYSLISTVISEFAFLINTGLISLFLIVDDEKLASNIGWTIIGLTFGYLVSSWVCVTIQQIQDYQAQKNKSQKALFEEQKLCNIYSDDNTKFRMNQTLSTKNNNKKHEIAKESQNNLFYKNNDVNCLESQLKEENYESNAKFLYENIDKVQKDKLAHKHIKRNNAMDEIKRARSISFESTIPHHKSSKPNDEKNMQPTSKIPKNHHPKNNKTILDPLPKNPHKNQDASFEYNFHKKRQFNRYKRKAFHIENQKDDFDS